jgi:predicted glutamine amidotransferase
MNSAQPADRRFSFTGFAQRGGARQFNFLLSNGKFMVVHCSTNWYLLQHQSPFAQAKWIDAVKAKNAANLACV